MSNVNFKKGFLSSFQYNKFPTIISIRTISKIFELFLLIYRFTSANTRCLANWSIHNISSINIHFSCKRYQRNHRGFCKSLMKLSNGTFIRCSIKSLMIFYFRSDIELMTILIIEMWKHYAMANGSLSSGRIF